MSRPAPTWSGRIPSGPAPEAWSFLHSLPHDRFLWEDDLEGTIAHVRALREAQILTATEAGKLTRELQRLKTDPEAVDDADEDVHSAIERALTERLGEVGAKVHAGRSRNDQVATALRLWTRRKVAEVHDAVAGLGRTLASRAAQTADLIAPGYTHLQRAQPVTVGHWLCAHAYAFARDLERLRHAYRSADVSPLGAGALAGNTLGLDPRIPAEHLGFGAVFGNSLDAVSDRDFLLDAAYACSVATLHLSRLAEEIVLWSSSEFGFIRLPDAYATGSSMMPQKKNPDVAELARGQTGPVTGTLMGLLMTLKALPLAYDRDLQADKQNLRGTLESTAAAFTAMSGLVAELEFDAERLAAAASDELLLATDLAEALVRRKVPFRAAHERVAALAALVASGEAASLSDAIASRPGEVKPLKVEEAVGLLDPVSALKRRKTPGGPSASSVRRQARSLERAFSQPVARGR